MDKTTVQHLSVGDEINFTREACGYETKDMLGIVKGFAYNTDNKWAYLQDKPHLIAVLIYCSECEYGTSLEWNNHELIGGCKKVN